MAAPNVVVPTLTLPEIQQQIGTANPLLIAARNHERDRERHRVVGADIRSAKVLTDATRLIGLAYAWWAGATPEARRKVRGFSLPLLQVAVHYGLALRDATTGAEEAVHTDVSTRGSHDAAAELAFGTALAERDQLVTALRTAAGKDETWATRIDGAVGLATTADTLASGIERLAAIGDDMLASGDETVRVLAESAQIDSDYLTGVRATAATARTTAAQAVVRYTAGKVSQGELDVLDGVNVDLLSDMIHAFDKAHERDGSIPRLVPIAIRRLLGRVKAKAAAPTPPLKPA